MFAFHSFPIPAIFTPAFSTPALWCRDFHSRVFHPYIMVPRFPLPRFSLPRIQRPRHNDRLILFSSVSNSVTRNLTVLLRPRERLRSIVMSTSAWVSVCLSVSVSLRENISGTSHAIFTIFVLVAYGRGSVLLRRRCDTLCNSGFVDDIISSFYNRPYSGMNFATKNLFC